MAAKTQNIQKLLQAEKRAQDVIAAARQRKNVKIKQAKDEAKAEVIAYKNERDTSYKQLESKIMGDKEENEASMSKQTVKDIDEMNKMVADNEKAVINLICSIVCDVKPTLHSNYKKSAA